ncbi:hypothetical protein J4T85_019680 [Sinorhizobium medicae]|uniref:hypothetical protein n=1 Tax=Sinorhizobium medicae TaxID=110321 RepID=UPI001AAFAD41|nr:hypothetical protein [Sinorhizobium medicae]MBO1963839.1 hypothetical protein [Sinorhizobium medicae]
MLSVDGYAPLGEFYAVAKKLIRWKLRERIAEYELRKRDGSLTLKDAPLGNVYYENIEISAKYVVYDLFISLWGADGKRAALIRGDGSKANLELDIFRPIQGVNRESSLFRDARAVEVKQNFFKRNEYIFGIQSLESKYWHDAFIADRVFNGSSSNLLNATRDPRRVLPLINWELGSLSLEKLKILVDALAALKGIVSSLEGINLSSHRLQSRSLDGSDRDFAESLLNMLEPYNGCPVVAPSGWLDTLYGIADARQEGDPSRDLSQPPRDRILDLWKQDPFLTKDDFKSRLFPEMSVRSFDMHWKQAADLNPEIRKPGRRKAKS